MGRISRPRFETLVFVGVTFLTGALVLLPLISILRVSFVEGQGVGHVSLRHFASVLGYTNILLNTVTVGLLSTLLCILLGGMLALIMARTDIPGRSVLERLIIIPVYITPLLTAIAWSWLGSPRSGIANLLARQIFGTQGVLVNFHSPVGVIVVTAISYTPLPFLLLGSAFRSMDPSLEENARILGASPFYTLRKITLPLVLPAILGSGLLVFVHAVGLFSVPAVLGMPADFYVATTEIYRLLENYPPRVGQAAAWGMILLTLTAGIIWLQNRMMRKKSFVTVTGKAFRPRVIKVGGWRYPLLGAVLLYILVSIIFPLGTLVWASLVRFLTVDFHLMEFGLEHYKYILFQYPKTVAAFRNSGFLGIGTATAVTLLSIVIAWIVVRMRTKAKGFLEYISALPLSIPGMVFGLGLLWAYLMVKSLNLYGTIWILLIAYTTIYLPVGTRATSSSLRQLEPALEEAARVSGASWLQTMRRVTFPLMRPTLAAAWTLLFIMSMQEVSSSILLYSSKSVVLSVAIFDMWERGGANNLAALGVIQLLVTFTAQALIIRTRHTEILG